MLENVNANGDPNASESQGGSTRKMQKVRFDLVKVTW